MKVLKPGIILNPWPRVMVCPTCKAELQVEAEDINVDGEQGYYIDCPECDGQPDVSNQDGKSAERWLERQESERWLKREESRSDVGSTDGQPS